MNGFEVMFKFHGDLECGPVGPARSNPSWHLTVPRVTVAAISSSNPSRPSGALSCVRGLSLRPTTQLPRRAPRSLSLGSLGSIMRI